MISGEEWYERSFLESFGSELHGKSNYDQKKVKLYFRL